MALPDNPQTKRETILLVDDEPALIDVTRSALGEHFSVRIATSGEVALKLAALGGIDLILLDIMMPDLSGYDVCQRLKAQPDTQNIPIIFLTSRDSADDEAWGLSLGAEDYIRKPTIPQLLQARIRNQLELKRHREHLETLVQERTRDLEQAVSQLESANQVKEEFLAVISHEMRTPLNSIIGFSEFLLEGDPQGAPLSPSIREPVRIIHESGVNLLGNINDIIDFVQMDQQRFILSDKPFQIDSFLEETLADLKQEAGRKGLTLEMEIKASARCSVRGDSRRLGQVLNHLIGNGIKFTKQGGVSLTVEATATPVPDKARLTFRVADTGCGISPEKLQLIFEAFTQVESPKTRRHGGFGLGLAICKKLVQMMSGELGVVQSDSSGTVIVFSVILGTEQA
ncbi:MAG: response regulator [Magnetococcales bacterium]|nr:response regulator [Magnetococcales bacterium]